ncbi:unnamed protein product [Agarophyton chilense]
MEFVAMDILGPLPKSSHGKRFVLVKTDTFTKFTRALPLGKTKATDVATAFLSHWVYPYGMPLYLLTDNGSQFVPKFFSHVCATLGIKHVTTTAYHPQTNGQVERFNRTLLDRLGHYVLENRLDWDDYVEPLVYAYNTQVHASTRTTPFDLTLTRSPLPIAVDLQESILPQDITEGTTPTQAKRYWRRRVDRIIQSGKALITKAQRHYKVNFDKAVWNTPNFGKGELVYLDRLPRDTNELEDTTWKLLPHSTGPYKVLQSNQHTIKLLIDGLQVTVSIDRVTRAPSFPASPRSLSPGPTESLRPQVDSQVSIFPKAVSADSTSPMDPMVNANDDEPSLLTESDGFAPPDQTLLPEN